MAVVEISTNLVIAMYVVEKKKKSSNFIYTFTYIK